MSLVSLARTISIRFVLWHPPIYDGEINLVSLVERLFCLEGLNQLDRSVSGPVLLERFKGVDQIQGQWSHYILDGSWGHRELAAYSYLSVGDDGLYEPKDHVSYGDRCGIGAYHQIAFKQENPLQYRGY